MSLKTILFLLFFFSLKCALPQKNNNINGIYDLSNSEAGLRIEIRDGTLSKDSFYLKSGSVLPLVTDAGYQLDIYWTGWRAPGKDNNADNLTELRATDFRVLQVKPSVDKKHPSLEIIGKADNYPFYSRVTYHLEPGKAYYRRSLSVCDSLYERHFLDKIYSARIRIEKYPGTNRDDGFRIEKNGGFGQPVALLASSSGMFAGMEYPAAWNESLVLNDSIYMFQSWCKPGTTINRSWSELEPVVYGLTPDIYVRNSFMKYLDDIKVHPSEPYLLYNSWYDLRSPAYPRTADTNHMTSENVMKIIGLFNKNLTGKYGIKLDAFVLDDGWDIYKSEWELNKASFPDGLIPVADELARTKTRLGIWLGPTGGYSFRMDRINHMKSLGYETVGTEFSYNEAMLCIAGKKYSALFEKRITDFVRDDKVGYFKWDGIQFSCSEPDHGHETGPYSLAACTGALINHCRAVRNIDPSTYLNITSGTWLSPWWLKYADQLWMDGEDYAYSESPFIFDRDGAITYRDNVLYDNFNRKKLWFPVSNLMTHGIIKGNLERLGGNRDPLDVFTNDVVMYLGRGISMWELYISPGLLTQMEWDALSQAILWGKDRKEILSNTVIIGGNPAAGDPYGYAHFEGENGIVVLRNPGFLPKMYKLTLDPSYGLNPHADSLILEKTYPSRLIAPKLFRTNESTLIPVDGYETVVLEIYPVNSVDVPLVAGLNFNMAKSGKNQYQFEYFHEMKGATVMNPWLIKGIHYKGVSYPSDSIPTTRKDIFKLYSYDPVTFTDSVITINFNLDHRALYSEVGIILDKGTDGVSLPAIQWYKEGSLISSYEKTLENKWGWYLVPADTGQNNFRAVIRQTDRRNPWKGKAEIWLITRHRQETESLEIEMKSVSEQAVSLPRPLPHGELYWHTRIGSVYID